MKRYYQEFDLAEVQRTFYKPPRLKTVEKWRNEAPQKFEFTVKAWQLITHPPSSPTYRKAGIKIPEGREGSYGLLRHTPEVLEAWEETRRICRALRAKVCLIQCPARFKPTDQNVENMRSLLSEIERDGITIVWEPRGEAWGDEVVEDLCRELNLTHVVDPFSRDTVFFSGGVAYLRLHGKPPGERMYYHRYTDSELRWLLVKAEELNAEETYVLFNNVYMREDAERFRRLLREE